MKKILSILVILTVVSFSSFAFEFGFVLNNSTGLSGYLNDSHINQSNKLSVFAQQKWTDVTFSVEGAYLLSYQGKDTFQQRIDLPLLKVSYAKSLENGGRFVLDAGRFREFDFSTSFIDTNIDGVRYAHDFGIVGLSVLAGYTGLLNNNTAELSSHADFELKTDKVYNLAHGFVLAGVKLDSASLLVNQKLALNMYGLFDTKSQENRAYAQLGLKGNFLSDFGYSIDSVLGYMFGEFYKELWEKNYFSNMTSLKLSYFPRVKDASISLTGTYIMGKDDFSNRFDSVTNISRIPVAEEDVADACVTLGGLTFSIKPTKNMLAIAQAQALLTADFKYTGFAYNAMYAWNIFTDLQLSVNAGQYIPKEGNANLKASLSFTTAF